MILIIGAGIAGLTCAKKLKERGINALIVEASDAIGGRVRTDSENGFLLDRGFQILLTAYPEAQHLLNYDSLDLKAFQSGALIKVDNQPQSFEILSNPFQQPSTLFQSLFSKIGSLTDKLRILRLVIDTQNLSDEILTYQGISTIDFLRNYGFSESFIQQFFMPFFGGVFLENDLATSSSFFRYIFGKFYEGEAVIPAKGIQEIPKQLASQLSPNQIRLNTKVLKIEQNKAYLANGEVLVADKIIVATDGFNAAKLLGNTPPTHYNSTTCTYFEAQSSPLAHKMLALNTNRKGLVHNLCVPSDIAPGYAPVGKSLISVSTQGPIAASGEELSVLIKKELESWFGKETSLWKFIKSYKIPHALNTFGASSTLGTSFKITETLYQCGDYTTYPSLNAAMMSGRKVAELL
ncbi:NAD(P)/FAD-dependent oxidoreductase [Flectobacillus major]|uniref:NAD(P)/FAD-dependent oxidoreductase n=1 Tax=Flectobacillus major TaxID=103 RepID=UPI000414FD58|nr:NAD(P)/FAD-dependent oxidoreductase [Flectobacillus major]